MLIGLACGDTLKLSIFQFRYGVAQKAYMNGTRKHHRIMPFRLMSLLTQRNTLSPYCLVNEDELKKSLNGKPTLVSIMFQNNETGTRQDIRKLAQIVHDNNENSIFHTDAVQAVGHTKINVKELGVDVLSASAHKFNGPKGIGFIYIREGCEIEPFILGGGQEQGMRSGTESVANIYSMAKALEDNLEHIDKIQEHVEDLEQKLIDKLSSEKIKFTINADGKDRAPGILNIAFNGLNGEGLLNMLDMHDICVSIGSACNSKSQDRSHVLLAIGLSEEIIDSSVRVSIGRYNTENDVEEFVKRIKKFQSISALAGS